MHNGQPPFTTNPILLKNLLAQVEQGVLQLPDFQRGWVWDDDRIKGVGGEFVGIRHRSIFGSREPGVPRDVVAMA